MVEKRDIAEDSPQGAEMNTQLTAEEKRLLRSEAPSHFVGIGASAGGLEAIETFFSHMPADSGMAFIVVQQLSPDYKSLMVELLSKRTPMPVHRAEEGMSVEPNRVYLIPPKKNLTIFHGRLLLSDQDHTRGINLPIDVFLRSLAEDQGESAVGVVLSGTGSDGMRGIRAIKESGGMVMVQDPESARFDGMPRSAISTGLADFILSPDQMPLQLLSFAQHPYVATPERSKALITDEDRMARNFALLREKARVDFTHYKPSTVVRRIERRMSVNQIHEIPHYIKYMESYPGEVQALYRELLIGVTSFFRDREAFEIIGEKWLPALLGRETNRPVRFWVAGCSTGEEAYSLAILCREAMERTGRPADVKIFATDIDRDAILRAGNGVYPESIAADLAPAYLAKYFHRRSENFQISRDIREMVVFAQHNLVKDPPFTNIDLVSCRNLLIYLQPVLQRKALDLFNFSLNPQGVLFLGSSETTGDMADYFEPLNHRWKIYRSRGRRRPAVAAAEEMAVPGIRSMSARVRHAGVFRALRAQEEDRVFERLLKGILESTADGILCVDEDGRAIHSNVTFAEMWRIPRDEVEGMADTALFLRLAEELEDPLGLLGSLRDQGPPGGARAGTLSFKDGRVLEWYNRSLVHERGVAGRLWSFRDVTAMRRLEVQYRQAQKMEAVGQLAGGVAHDFNNLLQVITGYVELSLLGLAQDHAVRPRLEQARGAAERATALVRQLLAFSRHQSMQLQRLDVSEVIGNVLRMLGRVLGGHVEIVFEPDASVGSVRGDPGQIELVLMNLALNSREAMPEGGRITIDTRRLCVDDGFRVENAWASADEYVVMTVSDTGTGIPEDLREHIFEPFFTTKGIGKGTGLGLATAYGIIKQHDGAIVPGKNDEPGAVFHVYFPVMESEDKGDRGSSTDESAQMGNGSGGSAGARTILVTEDDQMVREMAVQILESDGYRTIVARDGEEACEKFRDHENQVDLAFLDVVIPKGSGRSVGEYIRSLNANVPVLLCTGYDFNILGEATARAGDFGEIRKPYDAERLLRCIRGILEPRAVDFEAKV